MAVNHNGQRVATPQGSNSSTTTLQMYSEFNRFLDDFENHDWTRGEDKWSIPFTKGWSNDKYADALALENDPYYQGFTEYVINNADSDERVKRYLRKLELTTTGHGHGSILFDEQGNLKDNWRDEYRRLRNDQKVGFYHLSPLHKTPVTPGNDPGNDPGNGPKTPLSPKDPGNNYNPNDPRFAPLKDWNTSPLWNGLLSANALGTNARLQKILSLQQTAFQLAPQLHGQWQGDYAYLKAIDTQKAANTSLGERLRAATSDARSGALAALAANALNVQLAQLAALHEDLKFEQERQKLVLKEDLQSLYNTLAVNVNRDRQAALFNKLLEARAARVAKDALAKEENILANRLDFETFNKENWLNQRHTWESYVTNWTEDLQNALLKKFEDSTDISKDPGFMQKFLDYFVKTKDGYAVRGNLEDLPQWIRNYIFSVEIDNISPKSFADFIKSNLDDEDLAEDLRSEIQGYKYRVLQATKDHNDALEALARYVKGLRLGYPLRYTGQHPTWAYTAMNPHLFRNVERSGYLKSGGKISSQDRFLQYLEHNRRSERDNHDRILKYDKSSQEKLKRDLDAIDRESLLLLREIFK